MVSERIKDLRERDGYSQTALSKKLGLTRSSINAWETGISVPSTQYLVELSRLFKVSTDYILGMDTSESLLIGNLTIEQKTYSVLWSSSSRDITSLLKPWTWTLLLTQKRH